MTANDIRERAGTGRAHLRIATDEYATIAGSTEPSPIAQVAASNAILAGIAAADAICGKVLGLRTNDQDHKAAGDLLATVVPDGKALSVKLRRLLKDKSLLQYGNYCTPSKADEMVRNASALVNAMISHGV